ncbi:MAG: heavy metal-binding domain-containing protein, partial [Pseudomonadales bacterium]
MSPTATQVTYTCPMHPEIKEAEAGPCPKCGMALEPIAPVVATSTEWTCPMHPEIVQKKPGSCPICGMALEPIMADALSEEDNSELKDMTRRFWFSAVFVTP